MVMMVGGEGARRRRDAGKPPHLAFRRHEAALRLTVGGVQVEAHPEGGLWLAETATLIVSDLHLEKGSAFARRGALLPPYDSRETLRRLLVLHRRLGPRRIVSLGDSFHDRAGPERLAPLDRALLQSIMAQVDWVWIEGNHDHAAPGVLGGRTTEHIAIGDLVLRHAPTGAALEVAGHLHPCARVVGAGGSMRRRCFATDGERLVMPAFGAYAGGLNVRDPAFASVFPAGCVALVMGRDRVHAASRLAPDA